VITMIVVIFDKKIDLICQYKYRTKTETIKEAV